MKKHVFLLLGTLAALTLTSCGKGGRFSRPLQEDPTDIRLGSSAAGLLVGESKTLSYKLYPSAAYNAEVKFTSDNEDVVTVSNDGTLKAVGAGKANVTATAGDASQTIPVYVANAAGVNDIKSAATKALAYQAANPITAAKCVEVRNNFTAGSDGVYYKGYNDYCTYTVSETGAFVSIDGFEEDLYTKEGALNKTRYAWIFHTDEDYATHMYHISDGTKTRLMLNTQSYIGQDRINPIYDILDGLFRSGRKIATNQTEGAYEADFTEYASGTSSQSSGFLNKCSNFGTAENGDLFRLTYKGSSSEYLAASDEADYEIPAGTFTQSTYVYNMTWYKGVLVCFEIDQVMKYKIDNEDYRRDTKICFAYSANSDVKYDLPNDKEYREVGDVFDL